MPDRTFVFKERDYLDLKRQMFELSRQTSNLRNQLSHVSTRRHEGGYKPLEQSGIPFRNDSGEIIPAYAVMRILTPGSVTIDGREYVTVSKPNTTFLRYYLVNGGSSVAISGYGRGTWLTDASWVLYDDADTPAYGESWGPQNNSWELKKYRYGFTIVGNPTGGETDLVRATQMHVNGFIGKTDGTHNKSATGTISVYDGNRADTSIDVASVYNLFANVGNGKWVDVEWRGGVWYLTSAEC